MSREFETISRAAPSDTGLDYSALLAQGTSLVQSLTGAVWTNYNYSDPGVTILEQLCYALTELAYRADFPVQDLLGAQGSGKIDLRRQGLYPARAIMPVNPVTANDLRRLVIDRVPEVANAWFTPVPASEAHGVSGLYRITVLLPPKGCECECECHGETSGPGPQQDEVVKQVLKRYGAHRALCEDVQACVVLKAIPTRVLADVHLDDHSDPDTVLAQLLFSVGLFLMPEPKRTSLKAQIDAGRSTADIFNGPLMLRGFISDDQLMPLPRQVRVDDLLAVMVEVPGVLAVDQLSVRVRDLSEEQRPGDEIKLPDGHILTLNALARAGGYTLRLLYDGAICTPNAVRVQRLLERAWAAQRMAYPLWAEYGDTYRSPTGQGVDLSAYTSVQDQFPAVYGIGAYGLPADAGSTRNAQAKQLKGYLMPFDQLMADYFSQLAFLRDLFSIEAGGDKTYAWQSLRGIVPDVSPLLQTGYEVRMAALIASNDPVVARQSAVLDFLLSLYAGPLSPPRPTSGGAHTRGIQRADLLKAKQALLAQMVPATRDRGRGFDYHSAEPTRGMAGLEIRCRIELALLDGGGEHVGVEVTHDLGEVTFGQCLPSEAGEVVARTFLPIDAVFRGPDAQALTGPSPLAGRCVAAQLLPALADSARYRVGTQPIDGMMSLVCRDMLGCWWRLEDCRDVAHAVELTDRLVAAAANKERQRLYIVEWILLRHGAWVNQTEGQAATPPKDFSFRVSAVIGIPNDDEGALHEGWHRQAIAIVRNNMPAHVFVECVFLGPHRMAHFLRLYETWVHALRHGEASRRAQACRHLAHFLRPSKAVAESSTGERGSVLAPSEAPTSPVSSAPSPPRVKAPAPDTVPPLSATPMPASLPAISAFLEPKAESAAIAQADIEVTSVLPSSTQRMAHAALPGTATTNDAAIGHGWQAWLHARWANVVGKWHVAGQPPLGTVATALPDTKGFTPRTMLSASSAKAFVAEGFQFVVRDLAPSPDEAKHGLTKAEALDILQSGLALMFVQRRVLVGQVSGTTQGGQAGAQAVAHARGLGLPVGATVWMAFGAMVEGPHVADVLGYCVAWHKAVTKGGYVSGLHLGRNPMVLAPDLYGKLPFQHYCQASSSLADVAVSGFAMTQTASEDYVLDGIAFDKNVINVDNLGQTPPWLERSA